MEEIDVLIVGAGISGIGAAYHLQRACPGKSFAILEARDVIGGTWDLFRYPGIRSDSDMFTLGYGFKPWTEAKVIADGPSIKAYVAETARDFGIDRHIRFKHRVVRADWSGEAARWSVDVETEAGVKRFRARFLLMCAGYYKYEQGYAPAFAGTERFRGAIIHPQHWPDALDYRGKRIIIIGSGATAVTLAPAMSADAAHITMLQRSPSYFLSLKSRDGFSEWLRRTLPARLGYDIVRGLRIGLGQVFFRAARAWPKAMRRRLIGYARAQLGLDYDIDANFTPRYDPWRQRLCIIPDNDFFAAMRAGKVSVVTDRIESFTEGGVKLASGKEIEADIVVTATGLNLQVLGGAELYVDGAKVETGKRICYKGVMLSDVPNLAFVFGYTNASWTLRADLVSAYVCRLLNHMEENGMACVTPLYRGAHQALPFADFSSGYFQRAADILPKQTADAPWKQNQSYLHDIVDLRVKPIEDGALEFKRAPQAAPTLTLAAAES